MASVEVWDFRADDEISAASQNYDLREDDDLSVDARKLVEVDQSEEGSQTQPKEPLTLLPSHGTTNVEDLNVRLTASDQNQDGSQTRPKELAGASPLVRGRGDKQTPTDHSESPKVGTPPPRRGKEFHGAPNGNSVPYGINITVTGHFNQFNFNHLNDGRENLERDVGRESFRCKHRPSQGKAKLRVRGGVVPLAVALDVAEKVGADWRSLGCKLNFSSQELDVLEHDHRWDGAVEICYRMIAVWLEKRASSATYKNLGDALLKIRRCDVVKDCLEQK